MPDSPYLHTRHLKSHPLTAYQLRMRHRETPLSHTHSDPGAGSRRGRIGPGGLSRRLPGPVLHGFIRNLGVMIGASIPLPVALRTSAAQLTHPSLRAVVNQVLASVTAGKSLAEAFAAHGALFPTLLIQMSRIGESAGILGVMLLRAVSHLERTRALQRTIVQALAYPALVAVVAVAATSFLLAVVVPTFSTMFASFDAPLPAPTRALLGLSDLLKRYAVPLVIAIALSLLAGAAAWRTDAGRRRIEQTLLNLPALGTLLRLKESAHFSTTLGILLQNGIRLPDALQLMEEGARYRVMQSTYAALHDAVVRGHTLAATLRAHTVFPELLVQVVDAGEQSATLDASLLHAAAHYEHEVEMRLAMMTTVLEPLLVVVLGIAMGSILIALYLPLFDLVTIVQ